MLPPPVTVSPRSNLASIFLPKEHGSWSFALEPLVLGLLAAPSVAGGALAVATLATFLARRPLKELLSAGESARQPGSFLACLLLAACSASGLVAAAALGGLAQLWPLLLAVPFGVMFLGFDQQGEARAAAAEFAGGAAFALLPASLTTLAGWQTPAAFGLAAVMLARILPTILTLRTCLRLNKGHSVVALWPIAAAAGAFATITALAIFSFVPRVAAAGAFLLLCRTMLFVSPWRPVWPARRFGFIEAIIGLLYITAIGLAYRF